MKYVLIAIVLLLGGYIYNNYSTDKQTTNSVMDSLPCHFMDGKWMGKCEYDSEGNVINADKYTLPDVINTDTTGLLDVLPMQTYTLKDGDTTTMTAEYRKQMIEGKDIKRLTYSGMIPGPVYRIPVKSRITLQFTNMLDMETTIHSHGLRHNYIYDGMPDNPYPAIKKGESFSYELYFEDAGMYWYHPHVKEDYQQDAGMSGVFLVYDPAEENTLIPEQVLVIDDFTPERQFSLTDTNYLLMGNYGRLQYVNGMLNPNFTAYEGGVVRYYIVNTSNARPYKLSFEGAKMKVVGGDNGYSEKSYYTDNVIISPSERYIVDVYYPTNGTYALMNNGPKTPVKLATITTTALDDTTKARYKEAFDTLYTDTERYKTVRDNADKYYTMAPDKRLLLTINSDVNAKTSVIDTIKDTITNTIDNEDNDDDEHIGGIEYEDDMETANHNSNQFNTKWQIIDMDSKAVNGAITWSFKKDDMIKIRITNDENSAHPMQHPIHFHGNRFIVIATNGVKNDNLQWKDSVLVPAGDTIDIILETSMVGNWMFHCHIAEHLGGGMMGNFKVE